MSPIGASTGARPRSRRSSRTAPRPAIRISRTVPTSSCSARTRCRWTSSSAARTSSARGVQTGGAGAKHPGDLGGPTPATATTLGRAYSAGATTKSVNLMAVGEDYGPDNLNQLDLALVQAVQARQYPLPRRLRRLQRVQQRLAVHGHHHVLDRGHQPLAAADQRAAGAVLQDRRAVRLLTVERGARRIRRENIGSAGSAGSAFDLVGRWGFGSTALLFQYTDFTVISWWLAALALTQAVHSHPAPSSAVAMELARRPVPLRSGIGAAHDDLTTRSKQAQAFYDQGLAYLHSYVWLEAARSFNQALTLDPTLAIAHAGLSVAYTELNAPAASKRGARARQGARQDRPRQAARGRARASGRRQDRRRIAGPSTMR